jgi:hypothetical protein
VIHTAEPSPFEVEIAIKKLKNYEAPGSDQILAELIQVGGEILWSEIHKLINSIFFYFISNQNYTFYELI